jgi:hypothetical protein
VRAHQGRLEGRLARGRGDLHRLTHVLDGLESNTVDDATATGRPDQPTAVTAPSVTGDERRLAADHLNGVRVLMEIQGRTSEQDDRVLHMAHASGYDREQVGTPANRSGDDSGPTSGAVTVGTSRGRQSVGTPT